MGNVCQHYCSLLHSTKKVEWFIDSLSQEKELTSFHEVNNYISSRGGGTGQITKFHCFVTHFTLKSCSSETTKGGGGGGGAIKYTFSESSLQDQFRN